MNPLLSPRGSRNLWEVRPGGSAHERTYAIPHGDTHCLDGYAWFLEHMGPTNELENCCRSWIDSQTVTGSIYLLEPALEPASSAACSFDFIGQLAPMHCPSAPSVANASRAQAVKKPSRPLHTQANPSPSTPKTSEPKQFQAQP